MLQGKLIWRRDGEILSGEIQDLDWQSFIAPVQTDRKANERNVQEGVSMPVNVSEIEPDEKIVEIEME